MWQLMHPSEFAQVSLVVFLIYVLALRGSIAPAAITLLHERGDRGWLIWGWPEIGAAFLTAWTPMAVAAVATGMLTARGWWPWLSLFPVAAIVRHPIAAMGGLGWLLKRFWIFTVMTVVLGGGMGLGMDQVAREAPKAMPIVIVGMLGSIAFVMLVGAIRWVADWHRLRQFRRAEGPLPVTEFRDALDTYFSNAARVRFIRLVAARAAMRPAPGALTAVRDLSLSLERDLHRRRINPSLQMAYAWKALFRGRRPGELVLWDHAVLDELCRLEQRLMESLPPAAARPAKP
jgi:hypothetical protein